MVFLGDVFLNRAPINTEVIAENFAEETVVLNLECALQGEVSHDKLGPTLIVDTNHLLELCHIADIFCLANNHISDSGETGLRKTLNCLSSHNKKFCGVSDFEFVDHVENGCIVRIYSFTDDFYGNLPNLSSLASIKSLKSSLDEVDFLVANVHMGIEGTSFINKPMISVTNALVDLGFSCIFFHHAHIPSGYNLVHDTHVFYGLGNFIFDYGGSSNGLAVKVSFYKEGILLNVFNTTYVKGQLKIERTTLPKAAKTMSPNEALSYFRLHIAYHYAMAFNGAIHLLTIPTLVRYVYYSIFRRKKKLEFSRKLKYNFLNNSTYKYFYEWYNFNYRRDR